MTVTVNKYRPLPSTRCLTRFIVAASVLGIATLGGGFAAAQDHHPMRFERISLDHGLTQSNVLAIWQDSAGRMWFGTENGLNSYDGYEFRHFRHERGNPQSLASDFIYDIGEDADGNLWIATNGGGLARMAAGTRQLTTYRHDAADDDSVGSDVIRRLLIGRDGTMWLGTRGAGLDRFDPATGQARHFRFETADAPGGNPNEIHALYEDSEGALWIGSNQGLTHYAPDLGSVVSYRHAADGASTLSDNRVRAILEDSRGRFWVGTYDGGLNLLDPATGSFTRLSHDPLDSTTLGSDRVTSIFEDEDGRVWVGTSSGLNLLDEADGGLAFVRYRHDNTDTSSLGDDAVTAIFQDRGGVLWVGTQNRGLSKWNPRTWAYGLDDARELSANAESPPNVTSFVLGRDGRLWVGTYGDGVSVLDRNAGAARHFRHVPTDAASLSDDRVMSLLEDKEGRIWTGTMTGGINVIDPATGQIAHFLHDPEGADSLSADGVMALFEDSRGFIWVGTFGGSISRFDPATGTFKRFSSTDEPGSGPSSNRVTSFAEDSRGMIWIGTDAGGLNLFDPSTERFHHFRHDPADAATLAADTVYAVNVDAAGTVWVGTRGGGLDRVVGDSADPARIRFSNVSEADGLANDVVYGVQPDNSGRLWLSTNYGLSRLDPRDGTITNLHRRDGLQSEEFNFGAHYRSTTGELFFGGHNGFNAFRPEDLSANDTIPAIALTGYLGPGQMLTADGSIDLSSDIDLAYSDDVLRFEVAALDYAAPERNRYMYKLEGFDTDWVDLGHRRQITFTDLDNGSYVLRVKAANSDGVWNEAGLALPLHVAPAPWETWWAYMAYVLMAAQVAIALWLGHRRKIRREEEYSRRLEIEVRKRTEKLAESNEQLEQVNRALQESSLSDPLTGLRNRRFVLEEVSRDLDVIRRRLGDEVKGVDTRSLIDLTFMMIDLDHFKPINDTYGHAAGDRMLLEVRDVLLSTCRKSDFVIRWGGDEFVVIAKQSRPGESEALAERIRERMAAHHFKLGDGQIARTTCSIGFAAYPLFKARADNTSLDQIINLADDLMYEAKKKRNAWAGMLGPAEAATSDNLDLESIEPTSVLYRARRMGSVARYGADEQSVDDLRAAG